MSEKGVHMLKWWGFALLLFSHFHKYPMKMKLVGLTEANLFHFHRIHVFKNSGHRGGSLEPPESPLDFSHRCHI